jgi:hypothetical protein
MSDLELGASFWSELTGIPRISSPWPDRFAYLGFEDESTWQHQIILHRVTTAKRSDRIKSTSPDASTRQQIEPTWTSASTTSTWRSQRSRGSAAV